MLFYYVVCSSCFSFTWSSNPHIYWLHRKLMFSISFLRLYSVSIFRWNLLSWGPIDRTCLSSDTSKATSKSKLYSIDGQLASLSWCQAPFWGSWTISSTTFRQMRVCRCGAPSVTIGVCRVQLLLDLTSQSRTICQSYATADGQSASPSWCQSTIWHYDRPRNQKQHQRRFIKPPQHKPTMRVNISHTLKLHTYGS
jgi:hypothetical protein